MTIDMEMERLIKSKRRVRDFAEVYTPSRIVKEMCDLIPADKWTIESTFLEPACGNGNFLVEIYARKLKLCADERDGLKALASIVGIDIQQDNVDEARERLKAMYLEAYPDCNSFCKWLLDEILKNNIICADSLAIMDKWATDNNMRDPVIVEGADGQYSFFN